MTEENTHRAGEDLSREIVERPELRNDLWIATKYFDNGPEENLRQWTEAAEFLDSIVDVGDSFGNEAVTVALIDARDRAREEAKRARSEIRMRREWAAKQPKEAGLGL